MTIHTANLLPAWGDAPQSVHLHPQSQATVVKKGAELGQPQPSRCDMGCSKAEG